MAEGEQSGSGVPRVLIWVGLLILANVLSQVFHWGIIIY